MRHHNIFFADLKFYLWSIHMTNNLILAISVGFKLNSNLKSTVSSRSRWGSRPGFLSSLLCSKDAIVDENVTNFITEYNVRMLATFLWSSLETEGEKLSLRVYKRNVNNKAWIIPVFMWLPIFRVHTPVRWNRNEKEWVIHEGAGEGRGVG